MFTFYRTTKTFTVAMLIALLLALQGPTMPALAQASPALTAPTLTAPTLTAQPGSEATTIELRWDAVLGAVRYELSTWWASDPGWQSIGGNNLTGTSFTHTDVTAGTTYYYSIRAVNAAGDTSDWQQERASATVPTASAPTTPELTADAVEGAVELRWNAVPGAVRYELWTWWDAETGWQQIGGDSLTGTSFMHTDVAAETTYYYTIRAVNAAGDTSDWLQEYASATPTASGTTTPTSTPTSVTPSQPTLTPTATPTATETPGGPASTDRAVLVALYNATGGASWTNNANWLSDKPLGDWHGVTTDANGRVTALVLFDNGLSGVIPPELGNLTHLTELSLAGNQESGLSGSIPPELGNLANLENLRLGWNELSGSIPSELGNLANLTYLHLGGNDLSGTIPPELGNLANLESLVLWGYATFGGNGLSGSIPPELGNLSNLTQLQLHNNELSGSIPPELGNLSNLTYLHLAGNLLSGCIPAGLWDVEENDLATLDLPNCGQTSPPTTPALTAAAAANAVELRWNAVPGAVRYELWTWWDAETGWQQIGGDNLTGTSFTHTDVTAGTTYYYAIRAVNAAGETSDWLQEYASATPTASGTPTPTATPTATETPGGPASTDRAVLVALYNATGGASWTNNANWLSDKPLGDWHGVTTDANGRVTVLVLAGNGLSGVIPPELGNLANLTDLYLWGNQLNGSIPPELGQLSNLEWLHLNHNELTGTIPSELGNLANLTELYLSSNGLSGPIPPELGNLANLTDLYLWGNQLNGSIPPELGQLSNLEWLHLNHNELTGTIPSELGNLANLTELYLWGNQLSGSIPSSLGNLANLTDLDLQTNQLIGLIPSELGNLANLTYLRLRHNNLTGTIPSALGNLANLTSLSLNGNQLNGSIPSQLGNLANLTFLHLGANELIGLIPSELGNLANLERLYLWGNQLSGAIPPELDNLVPPTGKLESVQIATGNPGLCGPIPPALHAFAPSEEWATNDLDSQQFPTGSIPCPDPAGIAADRAILVALYNATGGASWTNNANWLSDKPLGDWHGVTTDANGRVTALVLAGNGLSGSIPPELGNLAILTRLNLGGFWDSETQRWVVTELSGPIPVELGNLANLTELNLAATELSGPIPVELGNLANLTELNLGSTELSGSIPVELGNLTNLTTLIIHRNELSGSIPVELGNLTNLTTLILGSTELSGSIPVELGNLTNLTYLNLWGNQLSGSIPSELGNLSNLERLYLDNNQLSGAIPSELGNLSNLQSLSLSSNELSGTIPSELGNLSNLQSLSLSSNELSGTIPSALGNLTNLDRLSLYRNELSGAIPSELGNLANLTFLHLGANELSGSIPSELGNLANLRELWLAGNQLRGCMPTGLRSVEKNDLFVFNMPNCGLADCGQTSTLAAPTLTATPGNGQITLTWPAVAGTARYVVLVKREPDGDWHRLDAGDLTGTTHTHTDVTPGMTYYYQMCAVDTAGRAGPWSNQALAIIVTEELSDLGLDPYYRKYRNAGGVPVVGPIDVSNADLDHARDIITRMLSNRSDLLELMAANGFRVAIYKWDGGYRGVANVPEYRDMHPDENGSYPVGIGGTLTVAPSTHPLCNGIFIHEVGHMVHSALGLQPGGQAFNSRLQALYQAARNAGLWAGEYAETNVHEYWAEAVEDWFGSVYATRPLAERDPEIAKLIEEVFGAVTPPAVCR